MPSMVSAERVRSRISACQPCSTSSFKKMVEVSLARRARSGKTLGASGLETSGLPVVGGGTALMFMPLGQPLLHPGCAVDHFPLTNCCRDLCEILHILGGIGAEK